MLFVNIQICMCTGFIMRLNGGTRWPYLVAVHVYYVLNEPSQCIPTHWIIILPVEEHLYEFILI